MFAAMIFTVSLSPPCTAGYHPTHPVIMFFWQAVEMFDNEQRLRLLQVIKEAYCMRVTLGCVDCWLTVKPTVPVLKAWHTYTCMCLTHFVFT